MTSRNLLAVTAMALACFAGAPRAAPLEAYGQLPTIDDVVISPDGSKIAYVTPVNDQQVVVVEQISPPAFITNLKGSEQKVRDLQWADSGHLLISKSVAGHPSEVTSEKGEWWMAQSLDLAKKQSTPLLRDYGDPGVSRLQAQDNTMNIIVGTPQVRVVDGRTTAFLRGISFVDGRGEPALFSVDLATGRNRLLERSLSGAWQWVVDQDGNLIAEYGYDQTTKYWRLRLKRASGWEDVQTQNVSIDWPDVEGISPDGSSLVVYQLSDGRYDYRMVSLKTGDLGPPLKSYSEFAGLIEDPVTHRVIGGVKEGGDLDYQFFNPQDQAAWNGILAAFPGEEVELASWSDDRKKIVVHVVGAVHGDSFQLVDLTTHKAIGVGNAYKDIAPSDVEAVETIEYQAADGRTIPAYLTLPNDRDAKKLPLVVLPHGGPAASDPPGFDWWAQALASRGYAVLQPQFRGSYGLGWEFMSAGFGQFGRKMQTDLSDGVRALAASGIIDPKRVCIVGASYGGYAALAGATLDTGVYRCAVSVSGLSDLHKFLAPLGGNYPPLAAQGDR